MHAKAVTMSWRFLPLFAEGERSREWGVTDTYMENSDGEAWSSGKQWEPTFTLWSGKTWDHPCQDTNRQNQNGRRRKKRENLRLCWCDYSEDVPRQGHWRMPTSSRGRDLQLTG